MFGKSKKIARWIFEISNVFREKELDDYVNEGNCLSINYNGEVKDYIVIDEIIVLVNHSNFNKSSKWRLYIKQKVNLEKNRSEVPRIKVQLDKNGLYNKIKELKKLGYKVKLFSDIDDKNLKSLGAIRGNKIKMNIERDFIKVETKYIKGKDV